MIIKIVFSIILILGLLFVVIYTLVFSSEWTNKSRHEVDHTFDQERLKDYPPPYPNGWFSLCSSKDIKKGQLKEISAFGQKLTVFRTEDGAIGVVDSFCPHLGANLSDGCVRNNRLICPFHGWEFDVNGICTKIPYSPEAHKGAHTHAKAWITQEKWGLVMVWHHTAGEAPSWDFEGYLSNLEEYKFIGSKSALLNIHLQEFFENGADYAHFSVVHKFLTIPFVNRWVHIKHNTEIKFGTDAEKHMAFFYDAPEIVRTKDNTVIKGSEGRGDVTYFGPGILVFSFTTNIANPIVLKTFTPVGPLQVNMVDYIYSPKGTPRLATKLVVKEATAQFDDDIRIWERKKFLKRPMLVKGDGPIMKMRKWYGQFYSESVHADSYDKNENIG